MIEKNVPLFAEKKDPKPTFRWYFCLYFKGPLRQFKTQRNIWELQEWLLSMYYNVLPNFKWKYNGEKSYDISVSQFDERFANFWHYFYNILRKFDNIFDGFFAFVSIVESKNAIVKR